MVHVSLRAARIIAACAAGVFLLAAGPLGCGSDTERAQRHVTRAQEFLAEDEREAALIELHNAVQLDPDNREASWLLAQLAISQGNLGDAVFYLREARRAAPEDTRAALELASLLYGSDPRTARLLAEDTIEREPDNSNAHRVLALVAVAMGDTATAVRAAGRAVELSPEDPESYWSLGWVHQALIRERSLLREKSEDRHFEAAIQAFDDYVARGGSRPWKARLEQARVYAAWPGRGSEAAKWAGIAVAAARTSREAGAMRQAVEHMAEVAGALGSKQLKEVSIEMFLEIDPSDLQAWKALADLRGANGGSREAVYREMLETLPEDADAHILFAQYILHTRGLWAALTYFDEMAEQGVEPARMLSAQINLYYASRQPELAEKTLARLEAAYPGDSWTELERAQALIRSGKPGEALLILDALTASEPVHEALILLANTELAMGNREAAGRAALAALESARRFDPTAWGELAKALYAAGNYAQAARLLSELEHRHELNDTQKLQLARSYYEIGETRKGRVTALELALRPEPPEVAVRTLVELERRVPEREVWLRRFLERGHERDPKEFVYLQLLTALDSQGGRSEEALARLDRSLERWPRSVRRLLLRAELADELGNGDAALRDARRVLAIKPTRDGIGELVLALHSRYGGIDDTMAEIELSLAADDAWAGRNAAGSVIRSRVLSSLHLMRGNSEAAIAVLERADSAAPGTPVLQRQLAYLLASTGGDPQRSLSLARLALGEEPGDPAALDTLGFVHLRRGEFNLALGFLRQAIGLASPPQPLYHFHESIALQALGREREALAAIETVLALAPDYPGAAEFRARLKDLEAETAPASS